MPTPEELHQLKQADLEHAAAISELRANVKANTADIARHDQHLGKLDETVAVLRESYGRVASKDDIMALSKNIDDKFTTQMRDAHNSIPSKIGLVLTLGSLVIALIGLYLGHHG